jgi:hypothetical protein
MDLFIFLLLSYLAVGFVYITREAGHAGDEIDIASLPTRHPLLRIAGGLAMMLLWPPFLLVEVMETGPAPMAVKINTPRH